MFRSVFSYNDIIVDIFAIADRFIAYISINVTLLFASGSSATIHSAIKLTITTTILYLTSSFLCAYLYLALSLIAFFYKSQTLSHFLPRSSERYRLFWLQLLLCGASVSQLSSSDSIAVAFREEKKNDVIKNIFFLLREKVVVVQF